MPFIHIDVIHDDDEGAIKVTSVLVGIIALGKSPPIPYLKAWFFLELERLLCTHTHTHTHPIRSMLPITNEYARNTSPPSFGGSRRHRRSSHSIPIILRRLFRFPQMDFEVRLNLTMLSIAKLTHCSSLLYGRWRIY